MMGARQSREGGLVRVTTELTLLSRVSYRGREITGPRLLALLALLAPARAQPAARPR
jgi:hypothetical protein